MDLSRTHIAAVLNGRHRRSLPVGTNRRACVLVPLMLHENDLFLLLTKRTDDVEHHKGQISFPGGMVDDGDRSDIDTALRETEEEIGIPRSNIVVLGLLDDIHIPTGFIVTPVVGYIDCTPDVHSNPSEVAEVLVVPFGKFFDPALHRTEERFLRGAHRAVHIYEVWKEPVWGATAHIIHEFTTLLASP